MQGYTMFQTLVGEQFEGANITAEDELLLTELVAMGVEQEKKDKKKADKEDNEDEEEDSSESSGEGGENKKKTGSKKREPQIAKKETTNKQDLKVELEKVESAILNLHEQDQMLREAKKRGEPVKK
eukprot:UN19340